MARPPVITVHHHYMPKAFFHRRVPPGGRIVEEDFYFTFNPILHDTAAHLRAMEEAGVDASVVHLAHWNKKGLAVCRELNDGFADLARAHPDRFFPCAHLPLSGDAETLAELNRAAGDLGFRAVALLTSEGDVHLGDESLRPLFARIAELGLPVLVHPAMRPAGAAMDFDLVASVERAADINRATVRVMYAVLTRFPDLRFVMPHHGGAVPFLKGRIQMFYKPGGVEIPGHIKLLPLSPLEREALGLEGPFEELFGKVYFDTAGFAGWMPATRAALLTVSPRRLCLGTDYPQEMHNGADIRAHVEGVRALHLPAEELAAILGGNIAELLGL
ncbi:MAG: amidohydrolase family protein [Nitrospinota bacterium]